MPSRTTAVSFSTRIAGCALVCAVGGAISLPRSARADVPDAASAPTYETVVVAPPAPREDQAAAASVVTTDRVARSGEDLPQVLSELPGAGVTRFGGLGSAAFVSLRGSTWEQVRIYVDGVPLNPVRAAELARAIGRRLGCMSWCHVPAAAARVMMGEVATLVVSSYRASPAKAMELGFRFRYPEVDGALDAIYGATSAQESLGR